MSNFSGLALSRMEMKSIKGGTCYVGGGGGSPTTCAGAKQCKQDIANNWGTNYCCSNCNKASWCKGGKCR